MSVRVVTLLYFYLVSIIAIILLIIGIYNAVTFVVNSTQYDQYPLNYGGIERCDYQQPQKAPGAMETTASMSAQDAKDQYQRCLDGLELERKTHRVNDMKNAFAFTIIGLILFLIHFPIALRKSNER